MYQPFTINEACKLIDHPVTSKTSHKPEQVSEIGLICGVLTLNAEPELVIKFIDGLKQYTRTEFTKKLRVIKD